MKEKSVLPACLQLICYFILFSIRKTETVRTDTTSPSSPAETHSRIVSPLFQCIHSSDILQRECDLRNWGR